MSDERMKCPNCGREVGTYIPSGGDGSAVRLRRHVRPDRRHDQIVGAIAGAISKWCIGSGSLGVWRNGEWVDL
jgi:hypothetical protein